MKLDTQVPCPLCGDKGGVVVYVNAVEEFHCMECGDNFSTEKVKQLIDAWAAVLAWVEQAPTRR